MDSETKGALGLALLLIVASCGWYFGYVQPRSDYLLAVAECTTDASDSEWSRCSTIVASARATP